MAHRDLHQALKTEVLATTHSPSVDISLARLQWGKGDTALSLHVSPHTYSTAGWQTTDFLAHLGFQPGACAFSQRGACYAREVEPGFDIERFTKAFDPAFAMFLAAQRDLEACGFVLDQPEGWQFFTGTPRSRPSRVDLSMRGDGHTAMKHQSMKASEDDTFAFKFTWLESPREKGWGIHYRPKHTPLSSELQSVFTFLGLTQFAECPEYDFESCYWRSIAFRSDGDGFFDSNANIAHAWFDAHSTRFSSGIEKLLSTNAQVEVVGLKFLPFDNPAVRIRTDIAKRLTRPKSTARSDLMTFDVAISFAGTERSYAEELAALLRDAGYSVFYDDFYPEYLWGKNLVETFDEIYRKNSRYCVMFVSQEYKDRMWTTHERRSAQARALQEKGREYILPIQVDDTELPGMPPTIGHVAISRGIPEIGGLLVKKLKA